MMLAIETIKVTETVGRLVFLIYSVSIFYSVALAHTLSKLERLDCIKIKIGDVSLAEVVEQNARRVGT